MSGGRYSRPHGREYGLHDSLITKEIVRQACPCVSNHVPDTNCHLKNLDGPSQGVRESNPLNSNKWFPPASASPTTRFILALPWHQPTLESAPLNACRKSYRPLPTTQSMLGALPRHRDDSVRASPA